MSIISSRGTPPISPVTPAHGANMTLTNVSHPSLNPEYRVGKPFSGLDMLDITSENLSHVTEAIVDLLCDVDEEPFRCSSGAIVSIKLIIYYSRRERERLGRMGSSYS